MPWCNPRLQFCLYRNQWRWSVRTYGPFLLTARSASRADRASPRYRWLCPEQGCQDFPTRHLPPGIPSQYRPRRRISRFSGTLSRKRRSARGSLNHASGRTDRTSSSRQWKAALSDPDGLFSAPSTDQSYLCRGRPSWSRRPAVFAMPPTDREWPRCNPDGPHRRAAVRRSCCRSQPFLTRR